MAHHFTVRGWCSWRNLSRTDRVCIVLAILLSGYLIVRIGQMAVFLFQPAAAQPAQDLLWCIKAPEKHTPEQVITGCTTVINTDWLGVTIKSKAHNNRGLAHGLRKEFEEALADLNTAIEIQSDNAGAFNNRAMTYLEMGKRTRALADADRAIEIDPEEPEFYDTRGQIYEALGNRDRAITDYRTALTSKGNLQSSKDGLARLGAAF